MYYDEDQYINLLLLALSQSIPTLSSIKSDRDIFETTTNANIFKILQNLDLTIDVKNVELVLSDDLYCYIGFKVLNEPCKGLKKPFEAKKIFGYPFKISVDKNSYLDFFTLKLNGYEVYSTTLNLSMKPAFYLPLHILEPISYRRCFDTSVLERGYELFDYQGFIQLTIERIFQAIDLLNSNDNLVSPLWIKVYHYLLQKKYWPVTIVPKGL